MGVTYLKRCVEPSRYTLTEIEALAERYKHEFQLSVNDELGQLLELSRFIAWLGRREKEASDAT